MEPIDTRDPAAAAGAYTRILNWPLTVGYRYRPRQGCTCGNPRCPTPGAHPVPGPPNLRDQHEMIRELEAAPGAGLIIWTTRFDAVIVPRAVGMAAMVALDHLAHVPCLVTEAHATLLVLPATGRYAQRGETSAQVRSGSCQWIAAPPTHGVRWDAPPWLEGTSTPAALLHGGDVGLRLRDAYKTVRITEARP
ncbi:hypothetical protein AB0469_25890 [Streptomyces sp. NPDC093801]|uniref:hypothetical protein n=1 Tax=Streptomyces sp. NPDC093801 TaxID=3155203 RepID=UPI00344EF0ED